MTIRNIMIALASILVAAASALVIVIYFDGHDLHAQTAEVPKPARAVSNPPAQAAPAAPTTTAPIRTETITYDAWTVSCRDTIDGKTKKVCSATLPIIVQQQNQMVTLGNWILVRNDAGALLSILQTPQVDIGVLIAKGIELKLGEGKPQKISFLNCNPQRCEGTAPLDDATMREWIAAANGTAVVTFWKADGAAFSVNIASIKGIDKAIAAVR